MLLSKGKESLLPSEFVRVEHSVALLLLVIALLRLAQEAPSLHRDPFGTLELAVELQKLEEIVEIGRPLGDDLGLLELDEEPLDLISP